MAEVLSMVILASPSTNIDRTFKLTLKNIDEAKKYRYKIIAIIAMKIIAETARNIYQNFF